MLAALTSAPVRNAIPGLLIGLGGALTSSQAGWLPPQLVPQLLPSLIVPALLSAVASGIVMHFVVTDRGRRAVMYGTVAITIAVLFLAQHPRADVTAAEADPVPSIPITNQEAPTASQCATFRFGDTERIQALPVPGSLGSLDRPLRVEASSTSSVESLADEPSTETELPFVIIAARGRDYDFVELSASLVRLPFLGGEVALSQASLDFDGRLVSAPNLRLNEDHELTGLGPDGTETKPVPIGIIELHGRFYDAAEDEDACNFSVHVQLVSDPYDGGPGQLGVLALLGGLLAMLHQLADAFRQPRTEPRSGQRSGGAGGEGSRVDLDDVSVDVSSDADEDVIDDRRLGISAQAGRKQLPTAMVQDTPTTIWVTIGPEDETITSQLPTRVKTDFGDADELNLPVVFLDTSPHLDGTGKEQAATMNLKADPSHEGAVSFEVTPSGSLFTAMITVFAEDGATVIEAATMQASVVPAGSLEPTESTFVLIQVPASSISANAKDTPTTGSVIHDDEHAMGSGEFPLTADVANAISTISTITADLYEGSVEALTTGKKYFVQETISKIAREGFGIYRDLALHTLETNERIQVVSFSRQTILPLEWVYEGRAEPRDDAEICPTWLRLGTCTTCCDATPQEQEHVICPSLFWGISKVVEHHGAQPDGGSTFALRPMRGPSSMPLPIPSQAVVGMSDRVVRSFEHPKARDAAPLSSDQVTSAVADSVEHGDLHATFVDDWQQWRTTVSTGRYDLLVVIAHNGPDEDTDSQRPGLEIGGDYRRHIEEWHVLGEDPDLQPLVFLLGCSTATEVDALASFAARFRDHAPIVVATVGKVLAEQSPVVLKAVIDALRLHGASADPAEATIGAAIRSARHTLIHNDVLAGLQLVVHGDGSWQLADPTLTPATT